MLRMMSTNYYKNVLIKVVRSYLKNPPPLAGGEAIGKDQTGQRWFIELFNYLGAEINSGDFSSKGIQFAT